MTPEKPLLRFTSHYDGNENRTLMTPSERGDWVHFCDVEPLVKALREARAEVERLREAAQQVHALAGQARADWPRHTAWGALVDIHKITKGVVK